MGKCRWIKVNKEIVGVKTIQGKRSQLFDALTNQYGLDKAVELYSVSQSEDFQDIFGEEEQEVKTVVSYVVEQNENKSPLTAEQRADLLLETADFKVENFYNEGLFTISNKLKANGYTDFEIENLRNDVELQSRVRSAVEALKNSEETPLTNEVKYTNLEKTSELNSFGKLASLNSAAVESELIETLVGIVDEDQYNSTVNQLEYSNVPSFEDVQEYQKAEEYKEVEGQISPRKENETELIIPLTVKQTSNAGLMGEIEAILSVPQNILDNNSQEVREVLKSIEDQVIAEGLDVVGISNRPLNKNFLDMLLEFLRRPSKENVTNMALAINEFFNISVEPKSSAIKIRKENTDYVKLNTNLSEEEVYKQVGLIKVEDGVYIKTSSQPLEELYAILDTFPEKLPKGTPLKEHVQAKIAELEGFNNAEIAEAVVLYKMYFDVGEITIRDKNGNLLAPNGKISNLNEEQWKLVRTPAFKAWFGDFIKDPENASKVVDENGEPLVVYHGTRDNFNEFKVNKDTIHFHGIGNYFTPIKSVADNYGSQGGKVMGLFLSIKKPIIKLLDLDLYNQDIPSEYDGVIASNYYKDFSRMESTEIVVENSNQIKSATEILGITSENTNDIRYLRSTPLKGAVKFTGDYNYLTTEFIADCNIESLREKQKDSRKHREFYSNFEINERGIKLKNLDALTVAKIREYASENLKQYSIISKQIPTLIEATEEEVSQRDLKVNNSQTVEKYRGQLFTLPNNRDVILKNSTDDFIKINGKIFESMESLGELTLYSQVDTTPSDYYRVDVEMPQTEIELKDYTYLNNSPESFSTIKKYLSREEEGKVDEDNFDCNKKGKSNIWKIIE